MAENAKIIPLIQIDSIFGDKKQFVIKVKEEDMHFQTETIQERFTWVDAIRQHMEAQRTGIAVSKPQPTAQRKPTGTVGSPPDRLTSPLKQKVEIQEEEDEEEEDEEEEEEEEEKLSNSKKNISSPLSNSGNN